MAPDPSAITDEVRAIARSPRNRNSPVVLCEGETRPPRDPEQRPSPGRYRRCAKYPDASFYARCVPPDWSQRRPVFYNCGGRGHVLAHWRGIMALCASEPEATTVDPDRLFALVDLDLSPQPLAGGIESVSDAHRALYDSPSAAGGVRLRRPIDRRHRLWVTSLIHKEACFVQPPMAGVIAEVGASLFDGSPLVLRDVHSAAIERLCVGSRDPDTELRARMDVVRDRLAGCAADLGLVCTDGDALAGSWSKRAANAPAETYAGLVDALFLVTKAKPLWSRVGPGPNVQWTRSDADWRAVVELQIADHIAHLAPHAHPIAGFMDWLRRR